jgi:hypothetical protein
MKFYLIGLVENGATRAVTLPDLRTPLRFPLGSRVDLEITVLDPSGASVLLTGKTLQLCIGQSPSATALLRKTVAPSAGTSGGPVLFTLEATDTDWLPPGSYVYEVWLYTTATPTERERIVPTTAVRLEATMRS